MLGSNQAIFEVVISRFEGSIWRNFGKVILCLLFFCSFTQDMAVGLHFHLKIAQKYEDILPIIIIFYFGVFISSF